MRKFDQSVSASARDSFIKMLWEKLRDNIIMVFVIKSNFMDKNNKSSPELNKNKLDKISILSPEEVMSILSQVPEFNHSNCTQKPNKYSQGSSEIRDAFVNEVNIAEQIEEPVMNLEEKMRRFGGYKKKIDDNPSYNLKNFESVNTKIRDLEKSADTRKGKEENKTIYKNICPKLKHIPEFDLQKMANVWQIVYYRMPNILSCFKLNIKNVALEARQRFDDFLGNFNDTVTWERCYLEIQSQGKVLTRRHFLQDAFKEQGLFENIIIDEEIHSSMRKSYVLEKKTVNQWYISDGLLMMRDCDSGDLAIFTQHLTKPSLTDISEAAKDFGVENIHELRECEEL